MSTAAPAILGWMTSLADPTRVRLLRLVERHELTVVELCTVLQLPQSTVSRHLKVLADDGWVEWRPEGTSRLYHMADGLPPAAKRLWTLTREQMSQALAAEQDDQRLAPVLAERQSRSQAFFSTAAGKWDKLRRELFGERFDVLGLLALFDSTWRVGDLGCGTGQTSEMLAPYVRKVIAVESSAAMFKAAKTRLGDLDNVELHRGDLHALPVDDGTLDVALLHLVLHHVAEPPAVLAEAARALVPGGRILLIDMQRHERREYQQQMGHVWLGFEPEQLTGWLKDAGFTDVRVHPLPAEPAAKGPALLSAVAVRRK
ncbi:metalloregulator ArsR/SmtB family transcription factor [Pyxidicoccus parkwayensis]|uniref:Metalloregulator ArsR/SmtB family transcription factor n=1 Tax=Pyxidicoccus parkwayensis TaxID=2813578 RepID=A0ABX7NQL4_9BACT|nr:metalloregulator ArsR/SmtB family transcription factor [Pyxidicoccus parkwaysis]QSQ20728.1 metalloregulator ArsR/SmtB family transcription factor [Pyxidicoccus parkwaysis]